MADTTVEDERDLNPAQPKREGFGHRLYTGDSGFDFVGKRRYTYIASVIIVLASVALLVVKGLNFGIDFAGGNTFEVPARADQMSQAEQVVQAGLDKANEGVQNTEDQAKIATVQVVGTGDNTSILVKTNIITKEIASGIAADLAQEFRPQIEERLTAAGTEITDESVLAQVSNQSIDATWGADVSKSAVVALLVFLVLVSIYLRFRYRWGLVVGALAGLLHDLVVATGIYALVGFEVTPATVIGLLTILGFSLYDTVVVFDKVDENTRGLLGGSRMTYSEAANLAINQTLMRSINTTIISVLPVAALLFVGAGLLGAGTLKDLALVLMVGMIAGTYSSVFLAAPIACEFAERQPEYIALARKVEARRNRPKATSADDEDSVITSADKPTAAKKSTAKKTAAKKAAAQKAGTKQATATKTAAKKSTAAARPRPNVGNTPKPGAKPIRKDRRG